MALLHVYAGTLYLCQFATRGCVTVSSAYAAQTVPASTAHPAVAPAPRLAAIRRHCGTLLLLLLGFVSAADAIMNSGMRLVLPAAKWYQWAGTQIGLVNEANN